MTLAEWTAADTRAVAMVLNGDVLRPLDLDPAPLGAASAMVIANGSATPVDMTIAGPPGGGPWTVVVDTTGDEPPDPGGPAGGGRPSSPSRRLP